MLIGNQNYIASSTALLACILEVMNLLEKVDQQIKLRMIQTETLSSAQQHWLVFHVYLSTWSQTY